MEEKEKAEQTSAKQENEESNREKTDGNDGNGGLTRDQQKKLFSALAYIFGILFFLPLIMFPDDDFAKFHANQGLVILIIAIIGEAVFGILSIIPVLKTVFGILCGVFGLLILVLCIFGVIGVANGEKKELPLIGKIRLLK